jgi:hypothetical protein
MTKTNENAAKGLDSATIVFTCRISKPGITRKVGSGEVRVRAAGVEDEVAQDPEASTVRVSKKILESTEYQEIAALDKGLRAYLRAVSLPAKLAGAQHLIPVAKVEEVDAQVSRRAEERDALVEKFLAVYPTKVEEQKARLGDLFDEEDYSSVDVLREEFSIQTSIAALEVPGAGLANTSKALYARELAKVQQAREQMVEEIRDGLRLGMSELVGALVEKLDPQDGSSPKVLQCQVEKLQAFVRDFSSLNVAGDEALEALVGTAKELISGADVKKMRSNVKARESVANGLRTVRAALDGMISSDSSTLRGGALDLNEPCDPNFVPTSIDPAVRTVDLEDNAKRAAPAPSNPERVRMVELEDGAAPAARTVEVSARAQVLELE